MSNRPGRVDGKVVIITGAASGLGKADAIRLAEEGAAVVLTDIDRDAGEVVARECGGTFLAHDVGDESTWPDLIEETLSIHGRLDVLVNNAGIAPIGDIETTTTEMWHKTLRVHLDGTFFGCRYAMPALKQSGGGSIVNMSSITALVGMAPYLAYSAAKGGIRSMTKAIAVYGASQKPQVRCNSIHPGSISTARRLRRGRLSPKTGPGSRLRGGGYPATWAKRAFMLPTASPTRSGILRRRAGS